MSLSITFFGPKHWLWSHAAFSTWFQRPDRYSTGGVGFQIPGLNISFTWGRS